MTDKNLHADLPFDVKYRLFNFVEDMDVCAKEGFYFEISSKKAGELSELIKKLLINDQFSNSHKINYEKSYALLHAKK